MTSTIEFIFYASILWSTTTDFHYYCVLSYCLIADVCNSDELSDVKDNSDLEILAEKMKETISHIRKQKESFSEQAKSSEQALLLHGLASPTGETQSSKFEDLHTAMQSFEGVKKLDKNNEKKPTADHAMAARQYRRRQTLEDINNPQV